MWVACRTRNRDCDTNRTNPSKGGGLIPSLLVVGAGPLQVPAIHEARALGIRSIAVDGNASAVGLALCDVPYVANILDAEAVSAIAERECIDGVMTLCTDAAVST